MLTSSFVSVDSSTTTASETSSTTREDYLNKIIGYLVDDTIIDFKENEIRYPYHLSTFSGYCKDTYGLTEDELDYVWKEYKNIITDRIKNSNSINESMTNKEKSKGGCDYKKNF